MPRLPSAMPAEKATVKSAMALPRSRELLRIVSSSTMTGKKKALPAPVRMPDTTSSGVVGVGRSSTSPTSEMATPARTTGRDPIRPAIQAAGTRRARRPMASAAKNRPMSAPASSARWGR